MRVAHQAADGSSLAQRYQRTIVVIFRRFLEDFTLYAGFNGSGNKRGHLVRAWAPAEQDVQFRVARSYSNLPMA